MAIEGIVGAPYKTPQVRRKVPVFSRPSITVGGGAGAVKRTWRDIPVFEVKVGDNVAGFGIVAEKNENINVNPKQFLTAFVESEEALMKVWTVKLINVMGDSREYPGEDRVFAFTSDQP